MNRTSIRLSSIKEESVGTLCRLALILTLTLFFAGTSDAQPAGPHAAQLIGTIQSNKFTGAVFSDSKGEQTFFKLHEKLPDGSQIVAVRSDSISLKGADGTSYDMFIAHDTKTVATIQPYSTSDPFAGASRKPPGERPLSRYEKQRQKRLGTRNSDNE